LTDDRNGDPVELPAAVGFADFLLLSWRLYARHWLRLTALFLTSFFSIFLLETVAGNALPSDSSSNALITIGTIGITTFFGTIVFAATHALLADGVAGRDTTIGGAFKELRSHPNGLLAAALISMGLAMVVYPILVPLTPLTWGPPLLGQAIVLENKTVGDAWSVTKERAAQRAGSILLFLLAAVFLVTVASIMLFQVPISYPSGLAGAVLVSFASAVVSALTLPYLAAAMLVVYFDARARKESFDRRRLDAERAAAQHRRAS
jgi:hypothetical protein